jgi:YidC/Oxa1 family membrane protein insertase
VYKRQVISLLILVAWDYFFVSQNVKKQPPKPAVTRQMPVQQPRQLPPVQVPQRAVAPQAPAQVKTFSVDTPIYRATWSSAGGTLTSLQLKRYKETMDPHSKTVDIVNSPMPLVDLGNRFNDTSFIYEMSGTEETGPDNIPRQIVFSTQLGEGIVLRKIYSIDPDTYLLGYKLVVENHTANPLSAGMRLYMDGIYPIGEKKKGYAFEGPVLLEDKHLEEFKISKVDKVGIYRDFPGKIQWFGIEDKYFIRTVIPKAQPQTTLTIRRVDEKVVRMVYDVGTMRIEPGRSVEKDYLLFMGPKELKTLKAADYNLNKALDFGFFDIIAKPLLAAMDWLYTYIKSYGLTIIVLTIIIKIILYPLTLKSFKSMKELQKIQPLMKEIQARYKDDKQKLNQEMMKLYSEHKINPMGGCLPMLLQIPILFALYKVFYAAIELRHTPFHIVGTWLPDLSAPDPYYITPVLMGASQFVMQKMSPAPGDPTQQKIMLIMPLFFTFLFLNFPSGLVLYWLVSNILSIIQQAYINRKHT